MDIILIIGLGKAFSLKHKNEFLRPSKNPYERIYEEEDQGLPEPIPTPTHQDVESFFHEIYSKPKNLTQKGVHDSRTFAEPANKKLTSPKDPASTVKVETMFTAT